MDFAVCGEHHRTTEPVGLAVKFRYHASGFVHQQDSGGGVPSLQAKFPESVKASAGDVGKIQRSRTVTAHAMRAQREVVVVMNIGIGKALVYREASTQQTGRESVHFGNRDRLAVQRGAIATRSGKELVINRMVDDASENCVVLRERNRDREARILMRKIGGAVERIDMPAKFGIAFVPGTFFCRDGMVGKIFRKAGDNSFFAATVRLSDQINVTFVTNVRRQGVFPAQNLAGFESSLNRGIQKLFWGTVRIADGNNYLV